jgi:hypothetical protein
MKPFPFLLAAALQLLLTACQLPMLAPASTPTPDAQALPTLSPSAALTCPSDFCYKPSLSAEFSAGCAADTSRELEPFTHFTSKTSQAQMCGAVGKPDWQTGSGLMIFVYDLTDGSRILAGFGGPDQIVYVHHVGKDGTSQDLLKQ